VAGGAVALLAVAVVAVIVIPLLRSDDPDLATTARLIETATPAADVPPEGTGGSASSNLPAGVRRFVIVQPSLAKYVVAETLRGIETTAVGTTTEVAGEIYLTANGLYDATESKFMVDLSTLRSDEGMRDNYIKQNTLQTSRYRYAEFVIEEVGGFPGSYTENQEVSLTLSGRLKIRDVEKPVTWTVKARQAGNTLTAIADTDITFQDFGMTPPNVQLARAKEGIHIQIELTAQEEG
jgi:polyisoprenoid-binding protein YceI